MPTTCYFLNEREFRAAEDARLALAKQREQDMAWRAANNASYGWAKLSEITPPGAMWYSTWYFDPGSAGHKERRDNALAAIANDTFGGAEHNYYLSRHYWLHWSDKRPPISVLCPDGAQWCVDAKSSNGDGWNVTGEVPRITASPSILVPGYHGFLRDGVFTDNL